MSTRLDESRLRPAGRATRAAIEAAATELFDEHGYDGASVRLIAGKAGIDPALVIRHFGSKEELFLHIYDRSAEFTGIFEGPVDNLGRELVEIYFGAKSDEMRRQFTVLAGAAHHDNVREALLKRTREVFLEPLVQRLDGERREARIMMALAAINGLLIGLYQYEAAELTDMDTDYLVDTYGAAVQRLLTP